MFRLIALLTVLGGSAGYADEDQARFDIASDRFMAGNEVLLEETSDDVFMAGQKVELKGAVSGTAHLAGRSLQQNSEIGGNLYAFGYEIETSGKIDGNATLAGFEVTVSAPVGGDLRVGSSDLRLNADVGGYALIGAEKLHLDGEIDGDLIFAGDEISFGDAAKVNGQIKVYAETPSDIEIPQSVASPDRVTILEIEEFENFEHGPPVQFLPEPREVIAGFLMGILITGIIATIIIAIAPARVRRWRALALAHPGKAILTGFLTISVLIGGGILCAMTIIGILALPFFIMLTALALYAGYILGAYIFGVGIWKGLGKAIPDAILGKFGLAILGAGAAAIIGLVPLVGWLFVMALTLFGVGAIMAHILPRNWLLRAEAVAD